MFRQKYRQKSIKKTQYKYTLHQLFQAFNVQPSATYILKIKNNDIKTQIHGIDDQIGSQLYQNTLNHNNSHGHGPRDGPKSFGLFAKIIKNMQIQKIMSEQADDGMMRKDRGCGYDYYDNGEAGSGDLRDATLPNKQNQSMLNRQKRQTTLGNIKRDDSFSSINSINNQYNSFLEMNKPSKQRLKRSQNKQLIDMNFSFDEINQQLTQNKYLLPPQGSNKNNTKIIDKNDDPTTIDRHADDKTENRMSKGQSLRSQEQSRIKEIFLIRSVKNIVKQICQRKLQEQSSNSQSGRDNDEGVGVGVGGLRVEGINAELNAQSMLSVTDNKEVLSGVKPIESQLYQMRLPLKAEEVQINFDLDIDFI